MKKMSRRTSLLLVTLLAILLASTLLFLYLKSSSEKTVTYTESRDLIRQITQQDARWENEILKARVAICHNGIGAWAKSLQAMERCARRLSQSDAGKDSPGGAVQVTQRLVA